MPQRSHCPILSQRTAPPPASKSSPSPKQLLINSSNYLNNERWVSWPFPCSFPFVPPVKKILAVEPWEDGNWRVTGEKLCGAWVSGLELAAGRAVVGEGSTTSSGQACGPASKVRKYRQYGGCNGLAVGLSLSCGSAEALTWGLYVSLLQGGVRMAEVRQDHRSLDTSVRWGCK